MKVFVAMQDLEGARSALARGERGVLRLNPTEAIARGLWKGEPVEVELRYDLGAREEGDSISERARAIAASLPVPEPLPGNVYMQDETLETFLAAVDAEVRGVAPPNFIPAATWFGWVTEEERIELAAMYVRLVERADEPAETHGRIPWSELARYLGVE